MQEERNQSQIIRKDAKNCFVESLSDAFSKGKAHFAFATYDVNKPAGQRQTNNVHIYISIPSCWSCVVSLPVVSCGTSGRNARRLETIDRSRNGSAAPLQRNCASMGNPDQTAKASPGCASFWLDRRLTFCSSQTAGPEKRIAKG